MKNIIKSFLCMTLWLTGFVSCLPQEIPQNYDDATLVQLYQPQPNQEMAVLNTNLGEIKFVLYEQYAPNTVKQFKKLVEEGFYNNNECYGIQSNISALFMGSSDEDGEKGEIRTDDNNALDVEFSPSLWHFTGAVSAYGDEKGFYNKSIKSDSRFFFMGERAVDTDIINSMEDYDYPKQVIDAYKQLGGVPTLTGKYTVFGQVVEGIDIINKVINSSYQEIDGNKTIKPNLNLVIENITITNYTQKSINNNA